MANVLSFADGLSLGRSLGDPAPILMDLPEPSWKGGYKFIYGVDWAVKGDTMYAMSVVSEDDRCPHGLLYRPRGSSGGPFCTMCTLDSKETPVAKKKPTPADVLNQTSVLGRSLNADERTTVAHFMEMYEKNVITHAQVMEILGLGPTDTVTIEIVKGGANPPKVKKGPDGKYVMEEDTIPVVWAETSKIDMPVGTSGKSVEVDCPVMEEPSEDDDTARVIDTFIDPDGDLVEVVVEPYEGDTRYWNEELMRNA